MSEWFCEKGTEYVLPKKPDIVRMAIRLATFGLNAVGICKREKAEKQMRYSFRLPNVSDKGARIRGPMPRETTKPVVAPMTALGVVSRQSAICSMPGVNIELASGLSTATGCSLARTINYDMIDLTGHQSNDSYIAELSRPRPVPWVLRIVVAEVEQLLDIIIRMGMFRCRGQKSTLFSYQDHGRSARVRVNALSSHLPSFLPFSRRNYERSCSADGIDDGGIIV